MEQISESSSRRPARMYSAVGRTSLLGMSSNAVDDEDQR